MKGSNIEIDCHFIREKIVSGDTRLSLLIQMINYYEGLGLIIFVTSWVNTIYMHQHEGSVILDIRVQNT